MDFKNYESAGEKMARGVTELGGLREIKTLHSAKKRLIPRAQSSTYLDLYMLKKEKDRLEKEIYVLDKREKSMQKRLNEIDAEMKKLKEAGHERSQANLGGFKKPLARDWKTMSLNY